MKSYKFVVLICCALAIEAYPTSNCSDASTCDACMADPLCAWCFDPQTVSTPRCFHPRTSNCREEYLFNPMASFEFLRAKDFPFLTSHSTSHSSYSSSSRDHQNSYGYSNDFDRNYITPEHVRASMRIGNEFRLSTFYVVKEEFPVDIYLIMDVRNPGEVKHQQLNSLASNIVDSVRNTTTNFRVGLGYISGRSRPIIHHTSMTTQTRTFLHSVQQLVVGELMVSGAAPLGAIVETACSGNIGWRTKSQKIVIFASDRDYEGHYDVNVKKTKTGFTSHICTGDFSGHSIQTVYQVSEINNLLNEKQINVVFAVTDEVADRYQELHSHIDYSVVTSLTTATSNIQNILRNFYEQQSLHVSLTDNSSENLNVRYYTNCKTGRETETNKCDLVKVGDKVPYTITVKLLSCPANTKDWNQKLQIRPENLNGQLTVDLKLLCSCPVEAQFHFRCHGNGHIVDGACQCNDNYFGDDCECAGEESSRKKCRANDTVSVDCNGRGTCVCGHCICDERGNPQEKIYGQYCEMDNYTCARGVEGVCSGRGLCIHSLCVCNEGWGGAVCNSKRNTCTTPTSSVQCSGHGTCTNDTCKCLESNVGRYFGEHCEKYELKQQRPECHGNGLLVNGQCICNENYFGRYCECGADWRIIEDSCRLDNTTMMECSGRGNCICGQCECHKRIQPNEKIYGRYCECDNYSCDSRHGLVCSGHGTCDCGQCHCTEDWSGPSCSCTTNTDTCYSSDGTNQEICSGHGQCICGQCQCSTKNDGHRYGGLYCTALH